MDRLASQDRKQESCLELQNLAISHAGLEPDSSDLDSNASEESEMESFIDYLPKIKHLLDDLGLKGFTVEPIQHGDSFENCVYGLNSYSEKNEQYILRAPVFYSSMDLDTDNGVIYIPILNDVALLNSLAHKLAVPRVKAYSSTKDNALGKPFMLQTRLHGRSLDKVWPELPQADRFEIVDQYAELLAELENVSFPTAGSFEAPIDMAKSMNGYACTEAPTCKFFEGGDQDLATDHRVVHDRAGPDVKKLLHNLISSFIAKDIEKEGADNEFLAPKLRELLKIVHELDLEGAFGAGPQPVVLHHWDLEPRNIMVQQGDNGTWRISGVIDWDDAQALPRVLTRRPPSWIWDFDDEEVTGYVDCDFHHITPLTKDNMELKQRFDSKAAERLPGYLEDAYGAGQWLRKIWIFAKSEIRCSFMLDLLHQTLAEWAERPTSVVVGAS